MVTWYLRNPNAVVAGVLILGALLSVAAFLAMRELDRQKLRAGFNADAEQRVRAIGHQIDGDLAALNALRGFVEVRYPVNESDFDRFARRLMEAHPSLLSVEWVSHLSGEQARKEFEAELSSRVPAFSGITQGPPDRARKAGPRGDYYAVRFLYPRSSENRSAMGYDLGACVPCKVAIDATAATGNPAGMGVMRVLENVRDRLAVPVFLAAFRNGDVVPADYALAMLQVSGVVESGLHTFAPGAINIRFEDESATPARRLLYQHGSADPTPAGGVALSYESRFLVANRKWKMICTPTAAYVASYKTPGPWLALAIGLLFTLGLYTRIRAGKAIGYLKEAEAGARELNEKLEVLVGERTALLKTSEARLRDALEASSDGFWEWNVVTGASFYSPRWIRLLGYLPEDVPPHVEFFQSILHPDDFRPLEIAMADHFAGRTAVKELDLRLRTKDGEYRCVRDRGKVVAWEAPGKPERMVGTITDITERKLLEEQYRQSQKMETIGHLAGGVAHDFNNLLTIINGYSERVLRRLPSADPLRSSVGEILKAGQRAADLTRHLLTFSRRQSSQPVVVDAVEIVEQAASLLRRMAGESIRFEIERKIQSGWIKADPTQFHQVLMNLTSNARDAMPNGGRLSIRVDAVDFENRAARAPGTRAGKFVAIEVADTGVGMDENTRARAFEPFFTTKEHGTGFGLATAHGIVHQHGGSISVESEPGQGATFRIYWPRTDERPSGDADSVRSVEVVRSLPLRSNKTVLVVEDEREVRRMVVEVLTAEGYRVMEADSGAAALDYCYSGRGPIDLLLTDVVMYGMNGREVADRLRECSPGIQVLFMSGYGENVIAMKGLIAEGVEFLAKPFRTDALTEKVRSLLDGEGVSARGPLTPVS